MRFSSSFVAALLALALLASAVHATDTAPAGYADAIGRGLAELEANNYPEAREEFRRAHGIFPNARTLRGLGMVEFELRNYAESVRLLKEALISEIKPLEGKLRGETEELLGRAQRYLGEVHVVLDPANAELFIDGARVQVPADGVLQLQVGAHVFEARAPQRLSEKRRLEVSHEESTEADFTLVEPVLADTSAPQGQRDAVPEAKPAYKKWWVWTTVALVAVAGGTAAALILTRKKERPEAQSGPNTIGVSLQTLRSF